MRYDLRAMSIGAILDRALRIYFGNFWILLAISLVFAVPAASLYLSLSATMGGDPQMEQVVTGLLAVTVNLGIMTLLQGALIKAISDIYLGTPPSLGRSLGLALSRFFPLLGGILLYTVLTSIGTMCCILPGIYLMGALFATIPVIMLERRGPIDALSRSWEISAGMRRRVFGAIFFSQALGVFVAYAVAIPATIFTISPFQTQALTHMVVAIVQPYGPIVLILLYYDLRVRREAFDLQVLASEMGRPPAAPAPGAAP
jgi:hypothetical protein